MTHDSLEPHQEPSTAVSCPCGWTAAGLTPHAARVSFAAHACLPGVLEQQRKESPK